MHELRILIALAAAVSASVACDGTETAGARTDDAPGNTSTLDQSPPMSDRLAPLPNDQRAPLPNDQRAPMDGQKPSTGSGGSNTDCLSMCGRAASLGCEGAELNCSSLCAVIATSTACQQQGDALIACAALATDCDGLSACQTPYLAFATCIEGGDTSDPITPTYTISDPACNVSSTCGSCTDICDACLCAMALQGASAATVQATCTTYCE